MYVNQDNCPVQKCHHYKWYATDQLGSYTVNRVIHINRDHRNQSDTYWPTIGQLQVDITTTEVYVQCIYMYSGVDLVCVYYTLHDATISETAREEGKKRLLHKFDLHLSGSCWDRERQILWTPLSSFPWALEDCSLEWETALSWDGTEREGVPPLPTLWLWCQGTRCQPAREGEGEWGREGRRREWVYYKKYTI